jgi:hypothetical protein
LLLTILCSADPDRGDQYHLSIALSFPGIVVRLLRLSGCTLWLIKSITGRDPVSGGGGCIAGQLGILQVLEQHSLS